MRKESCFTDTPTVVCCFSSVCVETLRVRFCACADHPDKEETLLSCTCELFHEINSHKYALPLFSSLSLLFFLFFLFFSSLFFSLHICLLTPLDAHTLHTRTYLHRCTQLLQNYEAHDIQCIYVLTRTSLQQEAKCGTKSPEICC